MTTPAQVAPDDRQFDAGFSMVEMLVAMALFGVLGTVLLGFALGTSRVSDAVRADSEVTGEARLAVERMTRELRQASELTDVTIRDGKILSFTVGIDFDGQDGVEELASSDDYEILTYAWDPDGRTLTLRGGDDVAEVLAGGVERVEFRLRSSQWIYDRNRDGTTEWLEIDQAAVSLTDGQLDETELGLIDLVAIELEVEDSGTTRRFIVQADMRNRDGGTS